MWTTQTEKQTYQRGRLPHPPPQRKGWGMGEIPVMNLNRKKMTEDTVIVMTNEIIQVPRKRVQLGIKPTPTTWQVKVM